MPREGFFAFVLFRDSGPEPASPSRGGCRWPSIAVPNEGSHQVSVGLHYRQLPPVSLQGQLGGASAHASRTPEHGRTRAHIILWGRARPAPRGRGQDALGRVPGLRQARLVPAGARARPPARAARVAELRPAPARHVEAAVRELDHVRAPGAARPARALREREHGRVRLRGGRAAVPRPRLLGRVARGGVASAARSGAVVLRAGRKGGDCGFTAGTSGGTAFGTLEGGHEEGWDGRDAVELRTEKAAAGRVRAVDAFGGAELFRSSSERFCLGVGHIRAYGGERDGLAAAPRGEEGLVFHRCFEQTEDALLVIVVPARGQYFIPVDDYHAADALLVLR